MIKNTTTRITVNVVLIGVDKPEIFYGSRVKIKFKLLSFTFINNYHRALKERILDKWGHLDVVKFLYS